MCASSCTQRTRQRSGGWVRRSGRATAPSCRLRVTQLAAAARAQLLHRRRAQGGAASILQRRRQRAPWTRASPAWPTGRIPACHCAPPPTPAVSQGRRGDAWRRRGRGSSGSGGWCWSGPVPRDSGCRHPAATLATLQGWRQRRERPHQRRHLGRARPGAAPTFAVAGADRYWPMLSAWERRDRASAQTVCDQPVPAPGCSLGCLHAA